MTKNRLISKDRQEKIIRGTMKKKKTKVFRYPVGNSRIMREPHTKKAI